MTSCTPNWSSRIYSMIPFQLDSGSLRRRLQYCRLIYDKYFNGRNRGKAQLTSKCFCCGDDHEDQEHMLYHCKGEKRVALRQQLMAEGELSISKIQDLTIQVTVKSIWHTILGNPNFHIAWCGLWHHQLLTLLQSETQDVLSQIQNSDLRSVRSYLLKLLSTLSNSALQIINQSFLPSLKEHRRSTKQKGKITQRRIRIALQHMAIHTATAHAVSLPITTMQSSQDLVRGAITN